MNFNYARLVFGALWLMLGVALFLRDSIGLEWMSARYAAENLNLGGGLAIAFAGWNAVRWFSGRQRETRAESRRVREPLAEKKFDRPFEYNPELDFLKPLDETKPPKAK